MDYFIGTPPPFDLALEKSGRKSGYRIILSGTGREAVSNLQDDGCGGEEFGRGKVGLGVRRRG